MTYINKNIIQYYDIIGVAAAPPQATQSIHSCRQLRPDPVVSLVTLLFASDRKVSVVPHPSTSHTHLRFVLLALFGAGFRLMHALNV